MSNKYLHDTKHIPPIDNQGAVLCCISQACTYIQFTNAISRKINHKDWNPSLNPSCCFSPRFTYLLSRISPDEIYSIIKDHGCITLDELAFPKDENGGSIEYTNDISKIEAISWNVDKNVLKNALKYRLTNYEHLSINDTCPDKLINKIKDSISKGNVVVSTTSLENWIMTELDADCGVYGKKGENVVVASRRYIPSGHSFAIVGYDDEITVAFSGVTFKGAFLITCSYGGHWQNNGYIWMLYDAIYPASQFEIMNQKEIYGGKEYFTFCCEKAKVLSQLHVSGDRFETQLFLFTPVGKIEIEGQTLTKYSIQEHLTKKYLCYENLNQSDQPTLVFTDKNTNDSCWCIIPYKEIIQFKAFESENNGFYTDSYWIVSANSYLNNKSSKCFIDSGLNYYEVGRRVGLSRFNGGRFPSAKSWNVKNISDTTSFLSSIAVCSEYERVITRRTYSLKDFWFFDWNEDIKVGFPQLMVDIELETVDRESFKISLLRFDKCNNKKIYTPAFFRTTHTQYVGFNDYMSFGGAINSEISEVGHFTFQYSDLLNVPYNTNLSDYVWGIEITSVNKNCLTIKNISLVNNNNEVISTIDLSNNPKTLCGESIEYKFV